MSEEVDTWPLHIPSKEHLDNIACLWVLLCFVEKSELPREFVTHLIMPLVASLSNIYVWSTVHVWQESRFVTLEQREINLYYSPLLDVIEKTKKGEPTFKHNDVEYSISRSLVPQIPRRIRLYQTEENSRREYAIDEKTTFYTLPSCVIEKK